MGMKFILALILVRSCVWGGAGEAKRADDKSWVDFLPESFPHAPFNAGMRVSESLSERVGGLMGFGVVDRKVYRPCDVLRGEPPLWPSLYHVSLPSVHEHILVSPSPLFHPLVES